MNEFWREECALTCLYRGRYRSESRWYVPTDLKPDHFTRPEYREAAIELFSKPYLLSSKGQLTKTKILALSIQPSHAYEGAKQLIEQSTYQTALLNQEEGQNID